MSLQSTVLIIMYGQIRIPKQIATEIVNQNSMNTMIMHVRTVLTVNGTAWYFFLIAFPFCAFNFLM